jgi:hypothetical protein
MSIDGKMSLAIRIAEKMPRMTIRSAITVKV